MFRTKILKNAPVYFPKPNKKDLGSLADLISILKAKIKKQNKL